MPDELGIAYHAATKAVIADTKQIVVRNWENLMLNGLDQMAVQVFTDATAPAALAMQNSVANLTSTFLANRTDKKPVTPKTSNVLGRNASPENRQDAAAAWADTYARPFIQARSLVKNKGMTLEEAVHRTAIRVAQMVDTDAQMSKLRQAHESLRHYGLTEYKRVNHPEDSETGTCALCLLASTQVYYTEDLMPIHTRCQCDVDVLEPGDITRLNGRRYVGLAELEIPPALTYISPRARPDSDRTIIAEYLQKMSDRQYSVIAEAWENTVEVTDSEIGPVMAFKKAA